MYAASERQYTAAGGQVRLPYLRVAFTSDGRRSEEIDTRIGRTNAVHRELFALWSQNGIFQTPQSCQFLNRSLFRSSLVVMNLGL